MKNHLKKVIIPSMLLLVAVLIVGSGCYEDPPNAQYEFWPDIDQDSFGDASATPQWHTINDAPANYIRENTDCDDTNANIHPDATELADNLIDEDCNDMLSFTFYSDKDGDGFGNPNSTTILEVDDYNSDAPTDYSWVAGDCDDDDANINPLATEIENNGIDDNCDGETDVVERYIDADGDGYGSQQFSAAQGVTNNLDCDDTDAEIHPYVKETLNDGIDNDCDGDIE